MSGTHNNAIMNYLQSIRLEDRTLALITKMMTGSIPPSAVVEMRTEQGEEDTSSEMDTDDTPIPFGRYGEGMDGSQQPVDISAFIRSVVGPHAHFFPDGSVQIRPRVRGQYRGPGSAPTAPIANLSVDSGVHPLNYTSQTAWANEASAWQSAPYPSFPPQYISCPQNARGDAAQDPSLLGTGVGNHYQPRSYSDPVTAIADISPFSATFASPGYSMCKEGSETVHESGNDQGVGMLEASRIPSTIEALRWAVNMEAI
ncbi:hypothetical protein RSAG8_05695, partial [Rhizoctonia solani AG-8 WAC10335]